MRQKRALLILESADSSQGGNGVASIANRQEYEMVLGSPSVLQSAVSREQCELHALALCDFFEGYAHSRDITVTGSVRIFCLFCTKIPQICQQMTGYCN